MSLRPMFMALAVGVLACGGESDTEDQTALPEEESALYGYGYRVSGTVSGAIVSGVTVALSGARSATATTSSTGYYSFSGLGNGTYTVTPSAGGFTFNPESRTVTVRGANVNGQNFTATASGGTHSISGSVSIRFFNNPPSRPWGGLVVSLSGAASATTTTDATGHYTFSGLADGTYRVSTRCPDRLPIGARSCTVSPTGWVLRVAGADICCKNFYMLFLR